MIICNDFHKLGSNRQCLNAALKNCVSCKITVLFISFFLFNYIIASAQFTDTYWKGRGVSLDFRSGNVFVDTADNYSGDIWNTIASICDKNGNLIFWSDGFRVFDRNNNIMPNGSNFNHGTISDIYINGGYAMPAINGAVVIPYPNDTNKFYMFYENLEYTQYGTNGYLPDRLQYLIVDKTLNGGLGDVTIKDQIVVQGDSMMCSNIFAIKHGNGKDWWLIARVFHSNKFYKILIDSAGINTPITQNIGTAYMDSFVYFASTNISLSGTKLAYIQASYNPRNVRTQTDFVSFDRCNGVLSNYKKMENYFWVDTIQFWSGCFSPDEKIYYTCADKKLFQIFLDSSNLYQSKQLIQKWQVNYTPSPSYFWAMKNAVDGKIYMSIYGSSYSLHVINNPNQVGLACNFVQNQLYLGSNFKYFDGGLPNTPNFALGAIAPCGNVGIEAITNEPIPIQNLYAINEALQLPAATSSFVLYNLYGQQIYDSKQQQHFTFVHSGLYIYQWHTTTGKWQSGKIVVQ